MKLTAFFILSLSLFIGSYFTSSKLQAAEDPGTGIPELDQYSCPDDHYYWDTKYSVCIHKHGGVMTSNGCVYAFDTTNIPQNQCGVPACSPTFSYSCSGNTITKTNSCTQVTENVKECDPTQDLRCVPGYSECKKFYEATMTLNPNPPNLGNDEIKVRVETTRSCSGATATYNLGSGSSGLSLIDAQKKKEENIEQSCLLEFKGCTTGTKPCVWEATCLAFRMKDNPYQASFNSGVTPEPGGIGNCQANLSYSVSPIACNNEAATSIYDSNGTDKQQVVAPALKSTKEKILTIRDATIPKSLWENTQASTLPTTGANTGFFGLTSLKELGCALPVISWIFEGLNLKVCPVKTNTAFEVGGNNPENIDAQEAEEFTEGSVLIGQANTADIEKQPDPQSCTLIDITEGYEGNKKLNQINTSLTGKGTVGYLENNRWNPPDVEPDTEKYNLSLQKQVLAGDQRVPEIKCAEYLDCRANFPDFMCQKEKDACKAK